MVRAVSRANPSASLRTRISTRMWLSLGGVLITGVVAVTLVQAIASWFAPRWDITCPLPRRGSSTDCEGAVLPPEGSGGRDGPLPPVLPTTVPTPMPLPG
jgi:hypothetical protein